LQKPKLSNNAGKSNQIKWKIIIILILKL